MDPKSKANPTNTKQKADPPEENNETEPEAYPPINPTSALQDRKEGSQEG